MSSLDKIRKIMKPEDGESLILIDSKLLCHELSEITELKPIWEHLEINDFIVQVIFNYNDEDPLFVLLVEITDKIEVRKENSIKYAAPWSRAINLVKRHICESMESAKQINGAAELKPGVLVVATF